MLSDSYKKKESRFKGPVCVSKSLVSSYMYCNRTLRIESTKRAKIWKAITACMLTGKSFCVISRNRPFAEATNWCNSSDGCDMPNRICGRRRNGFCAIVTCSNELYLPPFQRITIVVVNARNLTATKIGRLFISPCT